MRGLLYRFNAPQEPRNAFALATDGCVPSPCAFSFVLRLVPMFKKTQLEQGGPQWTKALRWHRNTCCSAFKNPRLGHGFIQRFTEPLTHEVSVSPKH